MPPTNEPSEDLRPIVDLHEGGKDSERISESLDVCVSAVKRRKSVAAATLPRPSVSSERPGTLARAHIWVEESAIRKPLKNEGCGRTPLLQEHLDVLQHSLAKCSVDVEQKRSRWEGAHKDCVEGEKAPASTPHPNIPAFPPQALDMLLSLTEI